ncbi:MAG: substrate-binding domain-containing protein [Chloroflexota bacterium]|jgi:molybdate-binding protein/DNA-binding transcriptional regulator YhcF (GntR family)
MSHLYQEIAEALRQQIASGDLPPGARLPSVRETARQWRCTPGTVSRAYRQLADEGLIDGHRGGGTRVINNVLAEHPPQLRWAELVNRAEQYLLEALASGHGASESQAALSIAISRWQALQEAAPTERTRPASQVPLRFAGSHDLAVELLIQRLQASGPDEAPQATFVGSLGGLMAMARDEADIAGVHLWDAMSGAYNLPFVRRLLPGRRLALVTLAHRALGLIVPPGNPQGLGRVADLSREGVRWVNRQSGSGTRVWLDDRLAAEGVDPEGIEGYERVETTHMGVAQAVKSGRATAGLGIQAAAAAYGLHFIPLTEEIYQIVVPETLWESPAWQAVWATIRSQSFQAAVAEMKGYNVAAAGQVTWT